MQTELFLIGGFLGAGKTTFLRKMSKFLASKGKTVGLITNDQASALVDTAFLREESGHVREVSGSCFCCDYNGFLTAAASLREAGVDTILAEPVGSCTDLSATIMQPLKEKNVRDFRIHPLSVFADPHRLGDILDNAPSALHPSAAYIIVKQFEEADLIVINKSDVFAEASMRELVEKTQARFPAKPVIALSAITGSGFEAWLEALSSAPIAGKTITEVDYDIYAEGEAVLGWLNMAATLNKTAADWDVFAKNFLDALAEAFDSAGLPVAHVKIRLENNGRSMLGNITGSKDTIQARNTAGTGDGVSLLVNARVETSPEALVHLVQNILHKQCLAEGIQYSIEIANCLSPGRPAPTYRYAMVVA